MLSCFLVKFTDMLAFWGMEMIEVLIALQKIIKTYMVRAFDKYIIVVLKFHFSQSKQCRP